MYRWYEDSDICFVFLTDVPSKKSLEESRWFTRGWTLQELIAPSKILFFDETWTQIEWNSDLQDTIAKHTGIPVEILSHEKDLDEFSVAQRMSYRRKDKLRELKIEPIVYWEYLASICH